MTFANGAVLRERIVTVDDNARRLVWTAEGGRTTHYNGAVEVVAGANGGATVTWTADFLPDGIKLQRASLIDQGMQAMQRSLDALAK